MPNKSEIRKQIIEKRNTLSGEFIAENSHIITEKLLGLKEYKNAETIFIYMNFGNEVATKDIIIDALANGKKVAIPKIADDRLEFYYINNIEDTTPGIWGIPEPNNVGVAWHATRAAYHAAPTYINGHAGFGV